MGTTALVILIVAIVIAIVIIAVASSAMGRQPRLRELPPESKDRFRRSWQKIEGQFIHHPAEAVREADRLAVMALTERGVTIHDYRGMPEDLQNARRAAAGDKGHEGTEGRREAMACYKRIIEDASGAPARDRESHRREVAS